MIPIALALVLVLPSPDEPWRVLQPVEATASGGASARVEDDGSVVLGGEIPDACVCELRLESDLADVTAVRIEALLDPSMTDGGPGRAPDGNFVLTEVEVVELASTALGRDKHVAFRRAGADWFQEGRPPDDAIDGKTDSGGWGADGAVRHEARTLVLLAKAPFGTADGAAYRVTLTFAAPAGHAAGRIRVAFSDSKDPERLLPSRAPPTEERIRRATERGIEWLLARQLPDGSWAGPDMQHYHGMTALAVYTLIQCGVEPDHPAVRAGLAHLLAQSIERTYDAGCALLALRAMGDGRPRDVVANLTAFLVEAMGNGSTALGARWGYPFGLGGGPPRSHTDLSNTQYALLGLRAGVQSGETVPVALWEKVAKDLLDTQGQYGSFSYQPGGTPGTSMTIAGMTALLLCAEQLEKAGTKDALVRRIEGGIALADGWMRANWSVDQNVELPRKPDSGADRWTYYYLYGLERLGSIGNRKLIGGHDWYAEGAESILRKQAKDGSFSTRWGEADANTCFALMFLRRGSRSTPAPGRAGPAPQDDVFDIAAVPDQPLVAWVRRFDQATLDRIAAGARLRAVDWMVDGVLAATVGAQPDVDPREDRFTARLQLDANGRTRLQAIARLEGPGTDATASAASREIELSIDGVEEPRHREAIADAGKNLIDPTLADVTASSENTGHPAAHAADRRAGTFWLSAGGDKQPWIKLSLRRAVSASALKLVSAVPWLGSDAANARPRMIEVQLNGNKPFRTLLLDGATFKQQVRFPKTPVKAVRITILTTYAGAQDPGAGFREIELFAAPYDGGEEAASTERVFAGRGAAGGTFRYTTKEPGANWRQRGFDDSGWSKGAAPFGGGTGVPPVTTPWTGADIWLRRTFSLDAAPKGRICAEVAHDDGIEIWINGQRAAESPLFSGGAYHAIPVAPAAQASLQPGENVLAVHVHDIGGASFFDLGLVEVLR